MISTVLLCFLSVAKERPEQDTNPDLCDGGAVLHRLSHQANWELVITMWVIDKPIDSGYMRSNFVTMKPCVEMMTKNVHDSYMYIDILLACPQGAFQSQVYITQGKPKYMTMIKT